MKRLLKSSKVLLAAFGVVQTVAAHYLNIPAEVWVSINGLIVTLIGATAYEDGKLKEGSNIPLPKAAQDQLEKMTQ